MLFAALRRREHRAAQFLSSESVGNPDPRYHHPGRHCGCRELLEHGHDQERAEEKGEVAGAATGEKEGVIR